MKKRILIVEDEEKLRRVLELQLMSAGFDVDKAATAEEGLKLVDRADMVLTDLRLPRMERAGFPGRNPSSESAVAGRHDDCVRQRGDRGRGDESGRVGLPAQAGLARTI